MGEPAMFEANGDGYRGPQVCKIVGITYRQLDYWARTDLVRPSVCDAAGSGTQRLYSYTDLVELKVVKRLLDAGISLQSARKAIEYLRTQLGADLASAHLVIDGTRDGARADRQPDRRPLARGQGVLNVVALGPVVDDLADQLHRLAPARAGVGDGVAPVEHGRSVGAAPSTPSSFRTRPFASRTTRSDSSRSSSTSMRIAWEYEPRTFTLEWDRDGKPAQAFSPDFYLPAYDLYIEITTLNQKLVTKKNRKARRLRELHPEVEIRVLYQRDYLHLLVKYGLEPPSQLVAAGVPEDGPAAAARPARRRRSPRNRRRRPTAESA